MYNDLQYRVAVTVCYFFSRGSLRISFALLLAGNVVVKTMVEVMM